MALDEIGQHKGENVDVTGRASVVGVYSKNPLEKREIIISDARDKKVNAVFFLITTLKTLWRGLGLRIDFDKNPVIKIKSIYVKEYSNKMCLSSHDNTQIFTDPENILSDSVKSKFEGNSRPERKDKSRAMNAASKRPKELSNYRVSTV